MTILPVLDLLEGVVVRGIRGRRDEYRPLESCLTHSVQPLDVARALRDSLGLSTLYVADLDAILHKRPAWDTYRALIGDGFALWIDAGLRDARDVDRLIAAGAAAVIIGLETWPDSQSLAQLCRRLPAEQIVFSLDLLAGKPLGDVSAWGSGDPFTIARAAIDAGVRRMIILDLAQVGAAEGLSTLELCRRLREYDPRLKIVTGGGVRGPSDLHVLREAGLDGVLVASALHNGSVRQDGLI